MKSANLIWDLYEIKKRCFDFFMAIKRIFMGGEGGEGYSLSGMFGGNVLPEAFCGNIAKLSCQMEIPSLLTEKGFHLVYHLCDMPHLLHSGSNRFSKPYTGPEGNSFVFPRISMFPKTIGPITRQISARAEISSWVEILLRLHDEFQPGRRKSIKHYQ